MNQLADNLKLIRLLSKQSQAEFGQKLDATKAMIVSYEKGKAQPNSLFIERICNLSGVSFNDLLHKKLTEKDIRLDKLEKLEHTEMKKPGPNQEFFQKYVEQLERNNAMLEKNLAQMEQRLRAVDKAFEQIEIMKGYMNRFEKGLEAVNTNLDEIAENQFLFGAVQQGWQEYWSEHLKGAPSKPLREVKEMIRIKVISLLHSYEEKGKSAVLQQDN